jgi:hypothetical protein
MSETTNVELFWQLRCQSTKSHAESMAKGCRREAAALIRREAERFCDQKPPGTDAELQRRNTQAMYVASKISSIAHADHVASTHPRVSDQILAETKGLLERLDLDDSPFEESLSLLSTITSLCSADMMRTN